jgi:hypothetical protein
MNSKLHHLYFNYFENQKPKPFLDKINNMIDWYGRHSNYSGTLFDETYKTTVSFRIKYWALCCGLMGVGLLSSPLWVPLLIKDKIERLARYYTFF